MSHASRKSADFEREVAVVLNAKRIPWRGTYQSAPDLEPLLLANGISLIVECKRRKALPSIISKALKQAHGYAVDATAVAVLREDRGQAVAVVALAVNVKPVAG
jgi:hypothetical protein